MNRVLPIRFWLPLLIVVGSLVLTPLFRSTQPPLQSYALALVLCCTAALSAYLFVVIMQPEKF